jgi:hypothetical protein
LVIPNNRPIYSRKLYAIENGNTTIKELKMQLFPIDVSTMSFKNCHEIAIQMQSKDKINELHD